MLGTALKVKYRRWCDYLEHGFCIISGGHRRFPRGSELLSQDLNHKEDLIEKEEKEKHSKYKDNMCKRPGGKQHGTFEDLCHSIKLKGGWSRSEMG